MANKIMENIKSDQTNEINSYAAGFTMSASIAVVFNIALVWIKGSYPAVNVAMKNLTGHHWITHGVSVVILFFILGLLFSKIESTQKISLRMLNVILVISVVLSSLGILGFYVANYIGIF